jgi:flagellar protein FliS
MTDEKKQEFTLRVSQANKTQMVVIIYDILLVYLEEAINSEQEQQYDKFRIAIKNAGNCVQELMDSLKFEYELAAALLQLYLYFNRELMVAETKKRKESIENIMKIVKELQLAYTEVAKADISSSVMGNTQNVYAGLTYGKGTLNESMENPIENRGFRV